MVSRAATASLQRRPADVRRWLAVACILSLAVGLAASTSAWVLLWIASTVAGALAILRWPLPAVLTLLALRTASKSQFLDLLTVFAGTLALLIAGPRLPGRRIWLPFGLLLVLALPLVPVHPSPDEGAGARWLTLPKLHFHYLPRLSVELVGWLQLASVLVAFLLTAWAVRDRRGMRAMVVATLCSAPVPIAIALQQFATGHFSIRAGFNAISGPFPYANYFAFYLVIVLAIAVVAFIETRSLRTKVLLGVLMGLAGFCLLETYTRGAWIGFCVVLAVLGALRYRRLFVIGAVGLVVAVFAFPGTVHKVERRFGDLSARSASAANNSWTWRTGEWRRMVHFGLDRPFTGQGFGSYSRLTVKEFGTEDPHYPTLTDPAHPATSARGFAAHNDYLRLFVETGVPGVLLWLGVLTGLLTTAWRVRKIEVLAPWACAGVGVAAALIIMSVADNILGYTIVLVYAATFVGALCGAARTERLRARARV